MVGSVRPYLTSLSETLADWKWWILRPSQRHPPGSTSAVFCRSAFLSGGVSKCIASRQKIRSSYEFGFRRI